MAVPAGSLEEVDVEVVDEVVATDPVEEGAWGADLRASSVGVVHGEGGNEGEGHPSEGHPSLEGGEAFHLKQHKHNNLNSADIVYQKMHNIGGERNDPSTILCKQHIIQKVH